MQEQLLIKKHLDDQIRPLLKDLADEDYILLDRGDGAAVCFLVDPETAFFFAFNLRESIRNSDVGTVSYEIRIGINLGPVKIVFDVNGERSILGEGINCAARIMDFAGGGQIYVSRSYFDVIGCLSQEYAELFSYLGKMTGKHAREFEVYEVTATVDSLKHINSMPRQAPSELRIPVDWDADALQEIEQELTETIGPIARTLVQRAMREADSLDQLKEILADPTVFVARDQARQNPAVRICGPSNAQFDATFLKKAEESLSRFIGPIAALLVKQAASRATDQADFAEILANELDDEREKLELLSKLAVR
jgi:hypothetical protein